MVGANEYMDRKEKQVFASVALPFIFRSSFLYNAPMAANENGPFRIWGADDVVYGPVSSEVLGGWITDERVTAETWVFDETAARWSKASDHSGFAERFRSTAAPLESGALRPAVLRRIKILAGLSEPQLARFSEFIELRRVKQFAEVVSQGKPGDALYMILEGELRVRIMVSGKETVLATLPAGELFGEMSLFDNGPRSTDVIANQDSVLLRASCEAFQKMLNEAPEVAAPLFWAICKTLAARVRADNKRFKESIDIARASH
jgi:hypothetical protein